MVAEQIINHVLVGYVKGATDIKVLDVILIDQFSRSASDIPPSMARNSLSVNAKCSFSYRSSQLHTLLLECNQYSDESQTG